MPYEHNPLRIASSQANQMDGESAVPKPKPTVLNFIAGFYL